MAKIKTFNILLFISIAILIFITIGYFSIRKNEKAVISDAIDAVPLDAAFIIETNNFTSFNEAIEKNPVLKRALNIKQVLLFKYQLKDLETTIKKSSELSSIFRKKKIIISAHSPKSGELNFLIAFKIYPAKKQKNLLLQISKHTKTDSSQTISYSNTQILSLKNKYKATYYYTITENIFLISKSLSLLKSAIRQKQAHNPISLDLGFKESATLSQNNSHLYINYNNLSDYLKNFFASSMISKINNIKKIANWSALDIFFKGNSISFTGNTFCPESADKYLDMFNNSTAQTFEEQDIIPYKTAEFLFLSTDNIANFYSNYEKYISSMNILIRYKKISKEYEQKNHLSIQPEILPLLDKKFLFVNVNFNNSINKYSKFVILKIKNISDFNKIIEKLYINDTLKYEERKLDNSKKIKIFDIKGKNFLKILVGELANFPSLNFFSYYKNYVIFGQSPDEVKNYIMAIYMKKTLAYNTNFKNFENSLSPRANVFYYTNNNFSAFNQISTLKPKYQQIYNKHLSLFKNFQFITIQYSAQKKNIFHTQINMFFNKNESNNGLTVWETELLNNIKTKPFFFTNHYTYDKEIFLSDTKNIVYLINKKGKILWKKKISEPIAGEIYMLDLFNNKKYQLSFCTTKHILTLDRNGEPVNDKITKLPDSTKFGLTVVDYDKNKNYRFFVPCLNNKIYLFDKNMKPVTGWKIPTTTSPIVSKIYYFNYNSKDYIVFAEKSKIHILNRKGQERITIDKNYSMPQNTYFYFQDKTANTKPCFVTSDASGNIINIYLNGKTSSKKLITVSANHTFIASDINGDKKLDYILTDGKNIFVYDNSGKEIFSYTFDSKILGKPIILKFSSKNIKIGLTLKNRKKVFLFNTNGEIAQNFPVQGNSLFSVGFLSSKHRFSLIVGNNNYLYNYIIF